MSSLFRIPFASLLVYSPRGTSGVSKQSRDITFNIKNDREQWIARSVRHLKDNIDRFGLSDFFEADIVLVPVPRSTPLVKGALWPAEKICENLLKVGIGNDILKCVERIKPIRTSRSSKLGERPSVEEQLETIEVKFPAPMPKHILLVDDVITKGTTICAASLALNNSIIKSQHKAFSLVRTMGLIPDIEKIVTPCLGEITYDGLATSRQP